MTTSFPTLNLLLDDIEHRILSPLSCLREFDNHWILEFDLPMVRKKDITVTFDKGTISVEAKLREKYFEENLGNAVKFEFFKKSILLPGKIESNRITTKFQKGRLEVKIPKKTAGHSIKIQ
ncbi:MAG: Hsp20/alpha crystallin family protein [Nitrosopumilus sp.]|uniref:Hsp20/alpha crystallin family protein n=1 Tax=Nitrosopumilus sp. TaxID=2024843 RepID=UPI00292FCED2|nr:Hsp20/alpha crystallin family protein [Nitrosopumilus sp.]